MTLCTPTRAVLLFVFAIAAAGSPARAQGTDPAIPPTITSRPVRRHSPKPPTAVAANLNLIVLDPAHGGQDAGARLGPNLLEKDVDLAFAQRLRSVLAARGFTVVLTRENDPQPQPATPNPDPTQPPTPAAPPQQLSPDARAEIANRLHPLACLLLHATEAGRGVHLYTSALAPVSTLPGTPPPPLDLRPIQLWDTAQAAFLPQSQRLADDLSQSVRNLGLPLIAGPASVSPVDAMSCAAVAIELAPTQPNGGSLTQPNDTGFQSRLADSITEALLLWRAQSAQAEAAAQPAPASSAAPASAKPKPRTRTRPVVPAGSGGTPAPAATPGPAGAMR